VEFFATPLISFEITTRPASLDDVEAVVELFNACSLELVGKPEFSAGELRGDWEMPGFDLSSDTLVMLAPAGELIGYGDLWGGSTNFVRLTSWVRVHPDYKGQGIGTYLNRWVEERARRDLDKAPEGARVVLVTHIFGSDLAARQLLEDLGMQVVRYAWQMEIELDQAPPAPQWPEDITVRLGRPGEEKAFYQARCDAFRDHWGYI